VESLKTALKGAYAVYVVTNYWEKMSADLERKQGMAVADVAKVTTLHRPDISCFQMLMVAQELGVQHLIFSSLLNINKSMLTNFVAHISGKL
jgi:hypothetical protein